MSETQTTKKQTVETQPFSPEEGYKGTCLTLSRTGDKLPSDGIGFWKIPKDATAKAVVDAIKAGYRHFDNACDYGNEKEVGEGFSQAFKEGFVTRSQIFVTSKLWNTYHDPQHVRAACEKSLSDLGLTYLDLYLVHFPIALKFVPFATRYPPEWVYDPDAKEPKMEYEKIPLHSTWGAMEELVDLNLTRNIGMCNLGTHGLRDMLNYARYAPQVLQVELHPFNTQEKLVRFCKQESIAVTGFSPLGSGSYVEIGMAKETDSALLHPVVKGVAEKLGKSAAQVLLRWGVQRGTAIIPKTTKASRMVENRALFDFEISDDDMAAIAALNTGRRFNDPGDFTQGMNSFCPIYD